VSLPIITNEVLKANIIEYVMANYDNMSTKNLIYMESFISGDTTTYRFYSALDFRKFLWPSVSAIFKLDSIYIGYRNLNNSDFEMPIEAVVGILAVDFPVIKNAYAMHLERKEKQKHLDYSIEADIQAPFFGAIGSVDVWTLKFVDGRLVSRSVYSEVDGTTTYF